LARSVCSSFFAKIGFAFVLRSLSIRDLFHVHLPVIDFRSQKHAFLARFESLLVATFLRSLALFRFEGENRTLFGGGLSYSLSKQTQILKQTKKCNIRSSLGRFTLP
jgi:hypothetical protein